MFNFFKSLFSDNSITHAEIKDEDTSLVANSHEPDTYEVNGVMVKKDDIEKTAKLLDKQTIRPSDYLKLKVEETLVHRGAYIPFINELDKPIWLSRLENSEDYSNWCNSQFGIETKFKLFSKVNILYVNHDWSSHMKQCPSLYGSRWNATLKEALKLLGFDGVLTVQNGASSEIMLASPQECIQPLDSMKKLSDAIIFLNSILATKKKIQKPVTVYNHVPKDEAAYFNMPEFRWFKLAEKDLENVDFESEIEHRHYQNITVINISEEEFSTLDMEEFPHSLKMSLNRIGSKALIVGESIFICKVDEDCVVG